MFTDLLRQVDDYYTGKLKQHGPTAAGVDWNSLDSQELRFRQLLKVCRETGFSLLDYGCGYGAILNHVGAEKAIRQYTGFDISEQMIESAKASFEGRDRCVFTSSPHELVPHDYVVASGIFNVKLRHDTRQWESYIINTLEQFNNLSRLGFAFNMLTSYSDAEYMRRDLYYGDPCFFFDHCKRRFARHVAILHDYGLYEFTILVCKEL